MDSNTPVQKNKGNKQSLQCNSLPDYQCAQLGSANVCGSASFAAVQMGPTTGGKERQLAQLAKQLRLRNGHAGGVHSPFPSPPLLWLIIGYFCIYREPRLPAAARGHSLQRLFIYHIPRALARRFAGSFRTRA